jgi:hypothetical protein
MEIQPNLLERRLIELAKEGITIITLNGKAQDNYENCGNPSFDRNGLGNFSGNPRKGLELIARFNDKQKELSFGTAELIINKSNSNYFAVNKDHPLIIGAYQYALKMRYINADSEEFEVELRAIQDEDCTYYFILPSREYLKAKPNEQPKPERFQ